MLSGGGADDTLAGFEIAGNWTIGDGTSNANRGMFAEVAGSASVSFQEIENLVG